MKILLVCDLFFTFTATGILVFKALQELGHDIKVWDPRVKKKCPEEFFDLTLVWSNEIPHPKFLNSKYKILFYLDDPFYVKKFYQDETSMSFEELIKIYDYQFFSLNKIPGYEDRWLPMGADPDIFFKINIKKLNDGVLFLGTNRKGDRENFVREIQSKLKNKGIKIFICGSGWKGFENWSGRPFYLSELNEILNNVNVVFNIHVGNLSPSDKVHVITCTGSCLLLGGNTDGYKECYPMAPVWKNNNDLIRLIKYYLEHDEERNVLIEQMQRHCIENFTYKKQLEKMIKIVTGDKL
ncbi:MAG: glycosyltransferase [archaeon]|nr:glycosyltransferase [archaeon]